MDVCEAREILWALVEGRKPDSEEHLPSDCIVHQASVLRAMLVSIKSLDSSIARAQRHAPLPDNVGRSWTGVEEEQLRSAFVAKEPIEAIAAKLRRTLRAVEARLQRMGLITAEERTTRGGVNSLLD